MRVFLTNPAAKHQQFAQEHYLGRGSFGIVQLQLFRGVHVAVKRFHLRASLEDVQQEAKMMVSLCHPLFPYLFGICTLRKPYKIVMQFHGFIDKLESIPTSINLQRELGYYHIGLDESDWLSVCAQLFEAIDHLHVKAQILHNDITCSNIVLGDPTVCLQQFGKYQIVIVDFGKATKLSEGKKYHLTKIERGILMEISTNCSRGNQWRKPAVNTQ